MIQYTERNQVQGPLPISEIQKISTFPHHDSERRTIVPGSQIAGQIGFSGYPLTQGFLVHLIEVTNYCMLI